MTEISPKILHLLQAAKFGGLETVVYDLCAGQAAEGIDVGIAVVGEPNDAIIGRFRELEKSGCRVFLISAPRRRYGEMRRALSRLLKMERFAVVHSHGYVADFLSAVLTPSHNVRRVSTIHGFTRGSLRNRLYERLQRALLRRMDAIITVSGLLAKELRHSGIGTQRISVIRNTVNTFPTVDRTEARLLLGIPENARALGFVGRFSAEKGPDLFWQLADRLRETVPQLTSMAIGDGPMLEVIRSTAAWSSVQHRAPIADVRRYFRAFDMIALTSRSEGVPMVAMEAAACGVPIAAFAVGGIPEVFDDSSALLASPERLEELVERIASALTAPMPATKRVENASALVGPSAYRDWISAHLQIYRTLLP